MCTGAPLTVNCSTHTDLLRWNITTRQESLTASFSQGRTADLPTSRTLNNILHVSLIREPSRLISTLSAEHATADLNESLIICNGLNFIDDGVALSERVQLNLVGNNGRLNINSTLYMHA